MTLYPVQFVGAGPGAPDLLTLRGARLLAEADCVIYAGSLVDERILELATHAECVNSAKMSLDEVIELVNTHYYAGERVVRLHTGDPAMYGAVSEQYVALEKLAIPYEVTPGVSSVFAAAAALKTELTMPNLSQTVILTREAGRTPVPAGEELEKLAAHGTTLCVFLSVGGMAELAAKLIAAGRSPETPAAVVYRASWENQMIVRGTLADIASKVEAAGIRRQSMIVVGEVLARNGGLSALYSENFTTGYRHGRTTAGFAGHAIGCFALTRAAVLKAAEIAAGFDGALLYVPRKFASLVPAFRARPFDEGGFAAALAEAWRDSDGLVMVMASGIVVRHIASLARDKHTDPAVVVADEAGHYAVSLLAGHVGGANLLASDVARITGGEAVISTASDVRHWPALDEFAARRGYEFDDPARLTQVAAAVLDGAAVRLDMPRELWEKEFADSPFAFGSARMDGVIACHWSAAEAPLILRRKRCLALGVGCRRGVPEARICEVVTAALAASGIPAAELDVVASASVKADEAGLIALAHSLGVPFRTFDAAALNQVEVPNPSQAAEAHLGIHSVSEAAALLAAGEGAHLILEKQAAADVTCAVAERKR